MNRALQTSNSAEWYTPLELYERICDVANAGQGFDLDPCAEPENRLKTKHFWTAQDNGLDATKALPVGCRSVFLNPPYGQQMTQWVERFNNHFAEHTDHVQAWLVPARTKSGGCLRCEVWRLPDSSVMQRRLKYHSRGQGGLQ